MATRVFSDEELERLRSFPEINREELIRFFTLAAADVEFIDPHAAVAGVRPGRRRFGPTPSDGAHHQPVLRYMPVEFLTTSRSLDTEGSSDS